MCQRLDCARFGQAGWPLDEQMTFGQKRYQQAFNETGLAENLGIEVSLQFFEDFKIAALGFEKILFDNIAFVTTGNFFRNTLFLEPVSSTALIQTGFITDFIKTA